MSEEKIAFKITKVDLAEFKRLDAYLAAKIPELSRSLIKKLFNDGIFTSTNKIELKKMPTLDTIITYTPTRANDVDIKPENIPLDILFEDDYLIIINKPAGLVVHPAPGNYTGTLVNAILYHCPNLKGIGNEKRPGIVHRLDKGTSGIMVVAKEQQTHNGLVELFSSHNIERKYQALCLGEKIPQNTTLEAPIGRSPHNRIKMQTHVSPSKEAVTHLKVLDYYKIITHVELTLETGRTHQIRVHLSELLNTPILNDKTYGREKEESARISNNLKGIIKDYEHPFLHAKLLGFIHPITKEKLLFEKEPPEIFKRVQSQLESESE